MFRSGCRKQSVLKGIQWRLTLNKQRAMASRLLHTERFVAVAESVDVLCRSVGRQPLMGEPTTSIMLSERLALFTTSLFEGREGRIRVEQEVEQKWNKERSEIGTALAHQNASYASERYRTDTLHTSRNGTNSEQDNGTNRSRIVATNIQAGMRWRSFQARLAG